jgi:cytochrome P450 family 6
VNTTKKNHMLMETCISLGGQIRDGTLVVTDFDGDDFVGQAFQFLAAGFETSGSTMSFALFELALHPEIQTRLRAEIMQNLNKHNGQLTYDGIQKMAYLDMVVSGEGIEAGCILIRTLHGKLYPSLC